MSVMFTCPQGSVRDIETHKNYARSRAKLSGETYIVVSIDGTDILRTTWYDPAGANVLGFRQAGDPCRIVFTAYPDGFESTTENRLVFPRTKEK